MLGIVVPLTPSEAAKSLAPPSNGARGGTVSLQYNYPAMGDRLCIVPATYSTMPVDVRNTNNLR